MPDTVETAVRAVLVGASGVTDLVSTRVYPNSAPQSTTKPFVVYEVDTLEPVDALSGHAGLTFAQFTITSWGATYSDAKAVSAAVLARLVTTAGQATTSTFRRLVTIVVGTSCTGPKTVLSCRYTALNKIGVSHLGHRKAGDKHYGYCFLNCCLPAQDRI